MVLGYEDNSKLMEVVNVWAESIDDGTLEMVKVEVVDEEGDGEGEGEEVLDRVNDQILLQNQLPLLSLAPTFQ